MAPEGLPRRAVGVLRTPGDNRRPSGAEGGGGVWARHWDGTGWILSPGGGGHSGPHLSAKGSLPVIGVFSFLPRPGFEPESSDLRPPGVILSPPPPAARPPTLFRATLANFRNRIFCFFFGRRQVVKDFVHPMCVSSKCSEFNGGLQK